MAVGSLFGVFDPGMLFSRGCLYRTTPPFMCMMYLQTLVIFVPFALLMRLVYFDDNPLSGLPTAKPLGRLDFYDTLMRTGLVFSVIILRSRTTLLAMITLGMMIALFTFTNMTLPYYNMRMNQVRSATYALLVWLSIGSLVTGKYGE